MPWRELLSDMTRVASDPIAAAWHAARVAEAQAALRELACLSADVPDLSREPYLTRAEVAAQALLLTLRRLRSETISQR